MSSSYAIFAESEGLEFVLAIHSEYSSRLGMFGFGSKKPAPAPEPCSQHACNIQTCLTKNSFQHERCKHEILKLQKCCEKCEYKSKHCGSLTNILGPSQSKKA